MQVGYISLHRKIQNCWFWDEKPFDRARAWIDLLLLAVHSNTKQSIDGDFVEISRGQYLTTVRRLADRWGWSKDKVSKFLSVLEKDGMITRTIVKKRTLLTIVNYGFYQGDQDNIESSIRMLIDEIQDKNYIEQLQEIMYQAQNEKEEIEPKLQAMYDAEEKRMQKEYWDSQF